MRVLFLCPHGAAKSVVAGALFLDHSIKEGRTDVEVRCAGTEPDAAINPIAVQVLERLGHPVPAGPRRVTEEDIQWADVVVSLGCSFDSLPGAPNRSKDWSDAPAVGDDAADLVSFVEARLEDLTA